MPLDDADRHFLQLAIQYYVAARSAALAALIPVCGNLFHHSIEMFLKARLSQTRTLQELSKVPLGHNLLALWNAFKLEFPAAQLDTFDTTIDTLQLFERIRYPDETLKHGAQIYVEWDAAPAFVMERPGVKASPRYTIVVREIDLLVGKIFEVCSRNPKFFAGEFMKPYAKDALVQQNPIAAIFG